MSNVGSTISLSPVILQAQSFWVFLIEFISHVLERKTSIWPPFFSIFTVNKNKTQIIMVIFRNITIIICV